MSDSPSVVVLVLNWNRERDTIEAVDSIRHLEYPRFSTLVLDNDSRSDSTAEIHRHCPGIEIVENGTNLGYAGGNNVGFRIALERGADYCLVLNNDVTVDPPMLGQLVRAAEDDPSIAILGPRVYRHENPDTLFYTGWKIDWRRWLFHRVAATQNVEGLIDVDFVQGCAMLVRCAFLRECGLFDERFHLYCEDADLCVRAQRVGHRTVELGSARVWHKGYGSSAKDSPLKTYYSIRNRLLFISKHAPRKNRLLLRTQILTFDCGSLAFKALKRMVSGKIRQGWATLRALGRALFDWMRGHYGAGPDWLFLE